MQTVLVAVIEYLRSHAFGDDQVMWDLVWERDGSVDVGSWDYQGRSHTN